jgi:hypothetical protein
MLEEVSHEALVREVREGMRGGSPIVDERRWGYWR